MKKIIIFISLSILLLSCNDSNNIEKNKILINSKTEIIDKVINNKNDLIELNHYFSKNNNVKKLYIGFNYYSDNDYKVFKNLNDFMSLKLDFGPITNIEKTLKIIANNIKNKLENRTLVLDFSLDKINFTEGEINILKNMNLNILEIHGVYPHISFPNPSEKSIKRYKKEKIEFDNNIKYILNNSKTLNKILILDYKIFIKNNGKIEIQDLRMSREGLKKIGL